MKYNIILFDLDGTLTDPFEGITKCVQYALCSFGINEPNLNNLRHFIGPPLKEEFEKTYNLTPEQGEEALRKYRERYSVKGLFENKLYPGINALLSELKRSGARLAIASSKPQLYVNKILVHFGINSYFEYIIGSEMDGRRTDKTEVIAYTLKKLSPLPCDNIVMVGDRVHDAIGAEALNIDFVAAGYGFSEPNEFDSHPCVALVNSVSELHDFLLK